jgi:superfamily II DNA/RNA helicase
MGFRNDILEILKHLPKKRQSYLFSATMAPPLRQVMAQTLRPGFVTVDCVSDGDAATHTHASVPQTHVVLSPAGSDGDADGDGVPQLAAPFELVRAAVGDLPTSHKIIAFFPTAAQTEFAAQLYNQLVSELGPATRSSSGGGGGGGGDASEQSAAQMMPQALVIHSRKSQSRRTRISAQFREAAAGSPVCLFSSDVSARGVDYPDVTHVLQFGLPMSREQYIHRLGRTGRAGKGGRGVLCLAPFESRFVREELGGACNHQSALITILTCVAWLIPRPRPGPVDWGGAGGLRWSRSAGIDCPEDPTLLRGPAEPGLAQALRRVLSSSPTTTSAAAGEEQGAARGELRAAAVKAYLLRHIMIQIGTLDD